MNRGTNPALSLHQDLVTLVAGAVGAGAAILTATPTTGIWGLTAGNNFYQSNTRTSTGLFVVTLKEMPPVVLDIWASIKRVAGSTLYAQVRTYNIALKQVTVEVRDGGAASAVADPTTADFLRITVVGSNSTAR